jgi:hypothetical protein
MLLNGEHPANGLGVKLQTVLLITNRISIYWIFIVGGMKFSIFSSSIPPKKLYFIYSLLLFASTPKRSSKFDVKNIFSCSLGFGAE